MAALVPAHVTVTYPEETPDESLLLRRAEKIAGETPPFRLRVGTPFTAESGVFLTVDDVEAGWSTLKRRLLTPPMTPVDFPPHVTVAHPRTSPHAEECAQALAGLRLTVEFEVQELSYTETTADTFTVLRRFAVTQRNVCRRLRP